MKKIFLLIVTTFIGIASINAQNYNLEAVAGLNMANCGNFDSKAGFHAGARLVYDLPSLYENVYFNAGLMFSLKGFQMDWGIITAKSNAYFLEIPLHIGYKHTVTNDFAVFGEAGPYLGLGLFGESDGGYSNEWDEVESASIKTFDGMKRFDVGAGLRVGVELNKKYSISFGYDWGMIDSYKSDEDPIEDYFDLTPSMKHKNLTISLSYKF